MHISSIPINPPRWQASWSRPRKECIVVMWLGSTRLDLHLELEASWRWLSRVLCRHVWSKTAVQREASSILWLLAPEASCCPLSLMLTRHGNVTALPADMTAKAECQVGCGTKGCFHSNRPISNSYMDPQCRCPVKMSMHTIQSMICPVTQTCAWVLASTACSFL